MMAARGIAEGVKLEPRDECHKSPLALA
jgi:hypothetical protein